MSKQLRQRRQQLRQRMQKLRQRNSQRTRNFDNPSFAVDLDPFASNVDPLDSIANALNGGELSFLTERINATQEDGGVKAVIEKQVAIALQVDEAVKQYLSAHAEMGVIGNDTVTTLEAHARLEKDGGFQHHRHAKKILAMMKEGGALEGSITINDGVVKYVKLAEEGAPLSVLDPTYAADWMTFNQQGQEQFVGNNQVAVTDADADADHNTIVNPSSAQDLIFSDTNAPTTTTTTTTDRINNRISSAKSIFRKFALN